MLTLLQNPLILAVLIVLITGLLLVPLALRLAGLTGAQIAALLAQTMQYAISLVHEFRSQNADKP